MKIRFYFSISLTMVVLTTSVTMAQENFKMVNYSTEDGGSIEATLFDAGKEKVVLFAHGAIFNKESWYFLAEKLWEKQVSSLSIDFRGYGNSKSGSTSLKYYDILGAINYLGVKGYIEINIIGGSMGAAAVLVALDHLQEAAIRKVVLLAPAGGPPIESAGIKKFFVVSKEEGLYDRVQGIYNNSSEPKKLKVYPGNTHAQHMFKTDYSEELQKQIIKFMVD